ncbi:MAG: hypothetical protein C0469_07655, partial [Cyanobacteria bacterium DS2.3.42]|nr:hypothetical protein [Cyanobacteria bacterium DS2.3.42]
IVTEVQLIVKKLEDEIGTPLNTADKGDPAGQNITNTAQMAAEYTLLAESDIHVEYSIIASIPTQLRASAKHVAVEKLLTKYINTGIPENDGPSLWIDTDRCPILHEALSGGYKMKLNPDKTVSDKPEDKHPWCDAFDSLAYAAIEEFGIPESIKIQMKKKSEEDEEDNPEDNYGGRRDRC